METLVLLLAPLAPHIAEELWQLLGHDKTLAYEPWPEVRSRSRARRHGRGAGADQRQAAGRDHRARRRRPGRDSKQAARDDARIAELLAGKTVVKVIVVPGRMVNFVVEVIGV